MGARCVPRFSWLPAKGGAGAKSPGGVFGVSPKSLYFSSPIPCVGGVGGGSQATARYKSASPTL